MTQFRENFGYIYRYYGKLSTFFIRKIKRLSFSTQSFFMMHHMIFCVWVFNHMKSFLYFFYSTGAHWVWFHQDIVQTNQNITLTIIRANRIIPSQIRAFLRVFIQSSYHIVSGHEVSILNHAYRQKHKTMVAKIARHRLIAFLIVSNNPEFTLSSFVWMVFISST